MWYRYIFTAGFHRKYCGSAEWRRCLLADSYVLWHAYEKKTGSLVLVIVTEFKVLMSCMTVPWHYICTSSVFFITVNVVIVFIIVYYARRQQNITTQKYTKIWHKITQNRVSTTAGNLLEFENPPGNPGNLLEFKWSSWKLLCNDRKLMMWHCLCIEECNIKMLLML